jgi:hypothetical protein
VKRTLTLNSEHLADLSGDELSFVIGAGAVTGYTCWDFDNCINSRRIPCTV